jgi:long-chain acyl-CoA synthetase
VLEFLRICFSAAVIEGYGQTEGTCATSLTPLSQLNAQGNVGVPLPCNEVKLVDVPGTALLCLFGSTSVLCAAAPHVWC